VNDPAVVTVPTGADVFVTLIGPLVPDTGQVIFSSVGLSLSTAAGAPFACTTALGVNPEPVIVTVVRYGPLVGEKEVAASTFSALVVVVLPPGVETDTTPVVAVGGIVVWIEADESDPTVAVTPPNSTLLALSKFAPEIVTAVPATPVVGEKLVITGGA